MFSCIRAQFKEEFHSWSAFLDENAWVSVIKYVILCYFLSQGWIIIYHFHILNISTGFFVIVFFLTLIPLGVFCFIFFIGVITTNSITAWLLKIAAVIYIYNN